MCEPLDTLLDYCLNATRQISSEAGCVDNASGDESEHHSEWIKKPSTVISGCGLPITNLLGRVATLTIEVHRQRAGKHAPSTTPDEPGQCRRQVDESLLAKRLEDLLSTADCKFHAFTFSILPDCWRQLYVDVRILMFHNQLLRSRLVQSCGSVFPSICHKSDESVNTQSGEVSELVHLLDKALIIAGGGPTKERSRTWINRCLELLENLWIHCFQASSPEPSIGFAGPPHKRMKRGHHDDKVDWRDEAPFSETNAFVPPVEHPIIRMRDYSMEAFQRYLCSSTNGGPLVPVIFTDLIEEWPAMTKHPWSRPRYLLSRTFNGRRLVPIEIGRSYVDEGWTQKLIPFSEFLSTYIDPPSATPNILTESSRTGSHRGYLAQHELFAQIPTLRNDILTPDYCWTEPPPHPDPKQNKAKVDEPSVNAWFGPAGTITPLHTDSMHNLLCQVVGRKYVRLYSPEHTPAMRPRGLEKGVDMSNTSMVDVGVEEGWDAKTAGYEMAEADRALFRAAEYFDCILEPGDTLYIPIGWWHYVRSLSVSFSVSFWWN